MLSRVADALYWMARNRERTENNAHIIHVQLLKMLEQSGNEETYIESIQTVLDICASKEHYEATYGKIRMRHVMDYLIFSELNINSLVQTANHSRENARMIRDNIPIDLWKVENEFYLYLQERIIKNKSKLSIGELNTLLQRFNKTSMIAAGIVDYSMSRDLPYYFIQIGKWLERAEKTVRIIKILLDQSKEKNAGFDGFDYQFALQLVHGLELYSRKHQSKEPSKIIQYLLADANFQRSVVYCIQNVQQTLTSIEREKITHYSEKMFNELDVMLNNLQQIEIEKLDFEELTEYVELMLELCDEFGKTFSSTYYLLKPIIQT